MEGEEIAVTVVAVGEEWVDVVEGGEAEARPPSRRMRYAFHETIIQNDTRSATMACSFSGALGQLVFVYLEIAVGVLSRILRTLVERAAAHLRYHSAGMGMHT